MDARVVRIARRTLFLLAIATLLIICILLMRAVLDHPYTSPRDHIFTGIWKAVYFIEPSSKNVKHISRLHEKPEALSQAQCIACHGYMRKSRKLPENSSIALNIHFHLFLADTDFSCTACHKTGGVYSTPIKDRKEIYLDELIIKDKRSEYLTKVVWGSVLKTNKVLCIDCHVNKKATGIAASLVWPKPHTKNIWTVRHGMVSRRGDKVCGSAIIRIFFAITVTMKSLLHMMITGGRTIK